MITKLIASICISILDMCGALYKTKCGKYGGLVRESAIYHSRTCDKWRWHTDSHSYKINDDNVIEFTHNNMAGNNVGNIYTMD